MYEETARRLREALERKGYSQQDLADMSGVSKASISQYVNGTHAPGNLSAMKMAKYLGVAPEYLMGFGETQSNSQYSVENAQLIRLIRYDEELTKALSIYFSLPADKKKYVTDLIKMLGH